MEKDVERYLGSGVGIGGTQFFEGPSNRHRGDLARQGVLYLVRQNEWKNTHSRRVVRVLPDMGDHDRMGDWTGGRMEGVQYLKLMC